MWEWSSKHCYQVILSNVLEKLGNPFNQSGFLFAFTKQKVQVLYEIIGLKGIAMDILVFMAYMYIWDLFSFLFFIGTCSSLIYSSIGMPLISLNSQNWCSRNIHMIYTCYTGMYFLMSMKNQHWTKQDWKTEVHHFSKYIALISKLHF